MCMIMRPEGLNFTGKNTLITSYGFECREFEICVSINLSIYLERESTGTLLRCITRLIKLYIHIHVICTFVEQKKNADLLGQCRGCE